MMKRHSTLTGSASLAQDVQWVSTLAAVERMEKAPNRKVTTEALSLGYVVGDILYHRPVWRVTPLSGGVLAYKLGRGDLKLTAESYRLLKRISARYVLAGSRGRVMGLEVHDIENRMKMGHGGFAKFISKHYDDVIVVDVKTGGETAYSAGDFWRHVYRSKWKRLLWPEELDALHYPKPGEGDMS